MKKGRKMKGEEFSGLGDIVERDIYCVYTEMGPLQELRGEKRALWKRIGPKRKEGEKALFITRSYTKFYFCLCSVHFHFLL